MKAVKTENKPGSIVYSCYHSRSREGEQFVPEHTFSYQIAGSLNFNDGIKEYSSKEGSFRFIRRNRLLKFVKQPPANGDFKSLSVYLDQETLRNFSREYEIKTKHKIYKEPVFQFKPDKLLQTCADSLITYQETNNLDNKFLVDLKLKEIILILLQTQPFLKDILFDFTEPHKIDLEAFMNKNFHFNVSLERFAYLTGRSLATFKRDFEKILNSTPGHWLQQKRLQEAHYLIKEKGKKASDIYLDLGFEDLSHFSYAFKKAFGQTPTKMSI